MDFETPNSGQIVQTPFPPLAPVSVAAAGAQRAFYSLPPHQTDIRIIDQEPENIVKAPVGYILPDTLGQLWVKTTSAELATGWNKMTLS